MYFTFVRSRFAACLRRGIVTSLEDLPDSPCGKRRLDVLLAECAKHRGNFSRRLQLLVVHVRLSLLCENDEDQHVSVLTQAEDGAEPAGSALPSPCDALLEKTAAKVRGRVAA